MGIARNTTRRVWISPTRLLLGYGGRYSNSMCTHLCVSNQTGLTIAKKQNERNRYYPATRRKRHLLLLPLSFFLQQRLRPAGIGHLLVVCVMLVAPCSIVENILQSSRLCLYYIIVTCLFVLAEKEVKDARFYSIEGAAQKVTTRIGSTRPS